MKTILKLGALLQVLPGPVKDSIAATMKDRQLTEDTEVKRATATSDEQPVEKATRAVSMYASTRHVDRDGEIVLPEGWDLSEFKRAPVHLWGHNYALPPVGSDIEIGADAYGLKSKTVYADTGEGTLPNVLFALRSQGHLKTSSVGFIPLERTFKGERKFTNLVDAWRKTWTELTDRAIEALEVITTKALLLEHSDVSVPANVNALTLDVAKCAGADAYVLRALGYQNMVKDLAGIFGLKGLKLEGVTPEDDEDEDDEAVIKVISTPEIVRVVKGPDVVAARRSHDDILREALDEARGRV